MRWTFDALAGALYVYVQEGHIAGQEEIAGVVLDVADDGSVLGIECLGFRTPLDQAELVERGVDAEAVKLLTCLVTLGFGNGPWAGPTPLVRDKDFAGASA